MSKSKVKMPKEIEQKCHLVIHTAAAAAATAAAVPIPLADAIPITAAQVAMITGLGKVFDVTITDAVAKAILGCGMAQNIGRALAANILKAVPGINIAVAAVNAAVATTLTEGLGWLVADDFFRLSQNEEPESIIDQADKLKILFSQGKQKTANYKSRKK